MIKVESLREVGLGEKAKLQFRCGFLVQMVGEAVKFNRLQIVSSFT